MADINSEKGALLSPSVVQEIPLSVEEFWSGFDDYLALQKAFSGHDETHLLLGGGRPKNGVGAEISFSYRGAVTREVLWQKDDLNHVWVMGLPEPNNVFSYYRATVGVWEGAEGVTRAKLTIDCVLLAEDEEERQRSFALMEHFIPIRIGEICRWVLHRDGIRSRFELEMDYPLEKYWAAITDWNDITWVKDATRVEQLGDDVRQLWFNTGTTLTEKLVSTDENTHTLVYAVLTSPMPAKMYEGTITLKALGPKKTFLTYDGVYLPNDGVDPDQLKAGVDANFNARVEWTKETFKE